MAKTSVLGAQRAAMSEETKLTKAWAKTKTADAVSNSLATHDSFQNFLLGMGMGTDNGNSASTYGFNPITRNRILCEWIYRGSWVGGVAVDVPANDMTRAGIEHPSNMDPQDVGELDRLAARLDIWGEINSTIKWGRLYGGAICVALIDGQNMSTPLRVETVGPDQFKGLMTLDRWMIDPSLQDLVTELGPHLGLPKFYTVNSAAPSLRGQKIHHSRVMVRHVGVKLPYNQRLTENLWGLSVYERLYDRLTAFDMATTGAAQLISKAYIRTLKVKDLRTMIAAGGRQMAGLMQQMMFMRRTQSNEGITLVDMEDEFTVDQHQAFSGLDSIITQFASQIAGALQIPMTRLMGQSPGGLNATGESDDNNYDDGIHQAQQNELFHGVQTVYQLLAQSSEIVLPDDFEIAFASLTQIPDAIRAEIAAKDVATVLAAYGEGLISQQTALMELAQLSRRTGRFTNITQQMIDDADEELPEKPPSPEEVMQMQADIDKESATHAASLQPVPGNENGNKSETTANNGAARPNGKAKPVADRASRRVFVSV